MKNPFFLKLFLVIFSCTMAIIAVVLWAAVYNSQMPQKVMVNLYDKKPILDELTQNKIIGTKGFQQKKLYLNGSFLKTGEVAFNEGNHYLSINSIKKVLKIKTAVYESDEIIKLEAGRNYLILRVGSAIAILNGDKLALKVAPAVAMGEYYVPFQAVQLLNRVSKNYISAYVDPANNLYIGLCSEKVFKQINENSFIIKANDFNGVSKLNSSKVQKINNLYSGFSLENVSVSIDGKWIILKNGTANALMKLKNDKLEFDRYLCTSADFTEDFKYIYWQNDSGEQYFDYLKNKFLKSKPKILPKKEVAEKLKTMPSQKSKLNIAFTSNEGQLSLSNTSKAWSLGKLFENKEQIDINSIRWVSNNLLVLKNKSNIFITDIKSKQVFYYQMKNDEKAFITKAK